MIQHTAGLQYFTSNLLPIPHGMFTRLGGCGNSPFDSLNLSFHVGDKESNIIANRALVRNSLGIVTLCSAHQVHGNDIVAVPSFCDEGEEFLGYDALISDRPGTGLLVQQADCQAVLLYDPDKSVIAAIHCGWKGSTGNIIQKTIERLEKEFRINPANLLALISPSLGPCCAEFINYATELPPWMHPYQVRRSHFDFWAISRAQLLESGVRPARIDTAGICTKCDERFFSYRRSREKGRKCTGRNGSIIALPR